MSRFTKELRVIPNATWIIAWFAYLCLTVPVFLIVAPTDAEVGKWPRWGQALLVYGAFLIVVAWVALVGYIDGDAKRRQTRYAMWTLLAIFVPYAIGMILYFLYASLCRSRAPAAGMSKRQSSHFVRTAARCCSQRARNVTSPLSPLGRIARIAGSNCPSRRRKLHKIHCCHETNSSQSTPRVHRDQLCCSAVHQ